MVSAQNTETFPVLSADAMISQRANGLAARRRRKSSSLGADPRGDTGANALATSHLKAVTPPAIDSPTIPKSGKERGRKRRKARRFLSRTKRLCLRHTWLIPLVLTLTILAAYLVSPGEHNPLHYAIFLSYANPPLNERTNTLPAHIGSVTQYGKGPKDFAFVAFYTIVLSFTREFLMQRMIRPLALYLGIKGRGKLARFMEQFYTAIYFAIFGPFGLYVMSRTPVWYFNTAGMYEGFPHRAHEALFKSYYLLQASYWAQQGLVLMLQLEKPRKDFKELVLHHVITLALIGLSYRFHFTYMGVAVYITHDVSDFFLAVSLLPLLPLMITLTRSGRPPKSSTTSTASSQFPSSPSSYLSGVTSATWSICASSTVSFRTPCPSSHSRRMNSLPSAPLHWTGTRSSISAGSHRALHSAC